MARAPRVHFPGALYHVLVRGNQRQATFRDAGDYSKYQERLAHYQKRYGFLLHAYVLMPNHVHLLIEIGSVPLSRVMQGLQFTYTQYFNKKYKTVGHVFQGRYKAILCEREAYLLELARYIHLNPVRAKLVKRPEMYRWSSYLAYLGRREEPMICTDFVLHQFGSKPSVARMAFQGFVGERLGEGSREELYRLKAQTFLGSDEFVEKLQEPSKEEKALYQISLEEIIKAVCQDFKVKEDDLGKRHRGRKEAEVRHVIGFLAKELAGFSYRDVGERFGREAISFGMGVRRVETRMEQDPRFRKRLENLRAAIQRGKRRKY